MGAAVLTVSLDGVMAPIKDGQRQAKREQGRPEGKQTRSPAGYREVGCGSVRYYDEQGERLAYGALCAHAGVEEADLETLIGGGSGNRLPAATEPTPGQSR